MLEERYRALAVRTGQPGERFSERDVRGDGRGLGFACHMPPVITRLPILPHEPTAVGTTPRGDGDGTNRSEHPKQTCGASASTKPQSQLP